MSFLRDNFRITIDTLYWCTCWNMSIYPHVRGMFTLSFNSPRYSRCPESHSSGFLYSALGCYCGWGGRGWVWDRYKGMRMGIKKEPVIRIGFVNPFDKQTMETPSFWTFTHYQHHPRCSCWGVCDEREHVASQHITFIPKWWESEGFTKSVSCCRITDWMWDSCRRGVLKLDFSGVHPVLSCPFPILRQSMEMNSLDWAIGYGRCCWSVALRNACAIVGWWS